MNEVYRKFGRTLRYEHGVIVRAVEAGEAVDDGQLFRCAPIPRTVDLPQIDDGRLTRVVDEIRSVVTRPLAIERLVVTDGIAEHQVGGRVWREETWRVHLSITRGAIRAVLDLGESLDDIAMIAAAMRNAGKERETPPRIALAPNVAAALLPSLVGIAPPNIQLWQTAGGLDGKGEPVETKELRGAPWPNWYRPSYRVRATRTPFHLRATCAVTEIEAGLPRAIALLAPPENLLLNVLCVDGGEVFPARVRVARIDAIAAECRWYPYAAGSFGAEMML